VCVCVRACAYTCVCVVCVWVVRCAWGGPGPKNTDVNTNTYTLILTHTRIHEHTRAHMSTRENTHEHMITHEHTRTRTHAQTQTRSLKLYVSYHQTVLPSPTLFCSALVCRVECTWCGECNTFKRYICIDHRTPHHMCACTPPIPGQQEFIHATLSDLAKI
jgi:hypothetical protein